MHPQLRKNTLANLKEALEGYAAKYSLEVGAIRAYYLVDDEMRDAAEKGEMPHIQRPPEKHRPLLDVLGFPLCALEKGWWDRDWGSLNEDDVPEQRMCDELTITEHLWTVMDGRRLVGPDEPEAVAPQPSNGEPAQALPFVIWQRLQNRLDQAFLFDPAAPNGEHHALPTSIWKARRRAGDAYRKVVRQWQQCLQSRLRVARIGKEGVALVSPSETARLPEMDGQVAVAVAPDSVHGSAPGDCRCGFMMQRCFLASKGRLSAFLITSHAVPADARNVEYIPADDAAATAAADAGGNAPEDDVMAVNLDDDDCLEIGCDAEITSLACTRRGRWVAALSAETGHVTVYEVITARQDAVRLVAQTSVPILAATCLAFDHSIAEPLQGPVALMPTLWVATRFGLVLGFEEDGGGTTDRLVCRRVVWSGYPLPITQMDVFGRRLCLLNDVGLVVHETPHPPRELRLFHECAGETDDPNVQWTATHHQLRFMPHVVSFAVQDFHGVALHRNGLLINFRLGSSGNARLLHHHHHHHHDQPGDHDNNIVDGDSAPPPLTFLQRALRAAAHGGGGGNTDQAPPPMLPYTPSLAPTALAIKRPLIAFAASQDAFSLVHPGTFWPAGLQLNDTRNSSSSIQGEQEGGDED